MNGRIRQLLLHAVLDEHPPGKGAERLVDLLANGAGVELS